ncbi:hypothetical protein ASPZODRAFT_69457 [Penicilliopsis zonata CBS 506.65]|uniref:Uncharacterized protein n=1 Tax=Penicilliopsis zonata CBS 506.65 TaxID=1073090 RepID=A0A1L9SDJ9_9EURO|nr:hypothetical protein ASPZODRAFT_69457 [Penicilliopsis zonata CBS 506.65]OJJ45183.1 hypothetical protein ASPZODRAFT_69457 [Penicilliopsis zonata CBS 506.65]
MVRLIAIGFFFLAGLLTANACTYCQCEFSDGSHCCVYSDSSVGNLDCTTVCSSAHRADGTTNSDGTAGTACNAGGSYKCASVFEAQDRTACYTE